MLQQIQVAKDQGFGLRKLVHKFSFTYTRDSYGVQAGMEGDSGTEHQLCLLLLVLQQDTYHYHTVLNYTKAGQEFTWTQNLGEATGVLENTKGRLTKEKKV